MDSSSKEFITPSITIRQIDPEEWLTYKNIRLEMLDSDPEAFPQQAFNDRQDPQERWIDRIKKGIVLVAFEDKKPVGMVRGIPLADSTQATIMNMYVNKDYRGQRIGELLLEDVVRNLKSLGISKMILEVEDTQDSAIKMYQKHGFAETNRIKQGDRDGAMIVMEKIT